MLTRTVEQAGVRNSPWGTIGQWEESKWSVESMEWKARGRYCHCDVESRFRCQGSFNTTS